MKVVIPSLIVTASASFTEMENLFSRLMSNVTGPNNRAFAPNDYGLSLPAENYGCWCHDLKVHTGKGKSRPVDELDALCKRLSDGYDCAAMDAEAKGETCHAWEQSYSDDEGNAIPCSEMFTQEDFDAAGFTEIQLQLLKFTPTITNECTIQACFIEDDFIKKLAKLYTENPEPKNPSYDHDSAVIDTMCPTEQCVGKCEGEKQCCGSVPGRHIYKSESASGIPRTCCGETVVLEGGMMECCEDGETAAPVGTCPINESS